MEDYDYIDALAKSELANRTAVPATDGWQTVQQKMKRKNRRKFLLFLLLFALLCIVGIYQGINFNSEIDSNSVTDKNIEQFKSSNKTNLDTESTSDKDKNTSQAGTNTSGTQTETQKNQHQTVNNTKRTQNAVAKTLTGINSNQKNKDATYNDAINAETFSFSDETEILQSEAFGLKLAPWQLVPPDVLKKKRKKQTQKKKVDDFHENLDLMIGVNGFFTPNSYQIPRSYVVEVSYSEEKKLKNNYFINYGVALQFRNLHFKKDSIRFNSGELSLNIQSNIEKRFGNFGIEAGVYTGYEFYSPNNELFNRINASFFDRKINYGLATALNYKKIGLVFKYELSPYINYLGNKKYGGFIIGVKYDF